MKSLYKTKNKQYTINLIKLQQTKKPAIKHIINSTLNYIKNIPLIVLVKPIKQTKNSTINSQLHGLIGLITPIKPNSNSILITLLNWFN